MRKLIQNDADMQRFAALLTDKKLRVTQPRLSVLEAISASATAVSQPDLEKLLGSQIDRVTLYRCLAIFEEKGILHKIFDLQGTAAYALCQDSCTTHQHADHHLHFICTTCNGIYCLEEIELPTFPVPHNFHVHTVEVHARGVCATCQTE